MPINGICTLVYGTDQIAKACDFFHDFGLREIGSHDGRHTFEVRDGSTVVVCEEDDPALPAAFLDTPGPREIIWGVDSQSNLDALVADLGTDRPVEIDDQGVAHTRDDAGIAIGFKVFAPHQIEQDAALGENSFPVGTRWNQPRVSFERATPGSLNHVVFGIPDVDRNVRFYTQRLGFRITDISRGVGVFMRCEGRHDHHSVLFMRLPAISFRHVSFGVQNIDEMMVGGAWMKAHGWDSKVGLGRHRVSSMLFYYFSNPAGGEAEFSADGDFLTDEWQPHVWDPVYGNLYWTARGSASTKTNMVPEAVPFQPPFRSLNDFDLPAKDSE
ncbi:VOC family protein [Paraburkholderia tropica]|uniref:VOC family protein n=1 Tax=Paraburkholderia tropica TaxID=92647 RepID=UPI002AB7CE4B|nr:VOC family protein [Paraburkholderia tropica]